MNQDSSKFNNAKVSSFTVPSFLSACFLNIFEVCDVIESQIEYRHAYAEEKD